MSGIRAGVQTTIGNLFAGVPALAGLRVEATEASLTTPGTKPLGVIRMKGLQAMPEAPLGARNLRAVLTIVHPSNDPDVALDELFSLLDDILLVFARTDIGVGEATVVGWETYLAVDIPLMIRTQRTGNANG